MELEFFGVRGSTPVSGKNRNKYGGHSPSVGVFTSEGECIILDAGTGIKTLGDQLEKKQKGPYALHLLLTHFHLDHIIGLPFFAPLYSPRATLHISAACSPEETEKNLSGIMAGRYFPLDFRDTPSKKTFKDISGSGFHLGGAVISSCPLHHPQGSVSYKIEENGKVLVYATDTEPGNKELDERLIAHVRGADLLVFDAMFTPEEYEAGRQGWGHSTWLEGTKVARVAGVRKLFFSHFNPDHSDKMIDAFVSRARKEFSSCSGAREGQRIPL